MTTIPDPRPRPGTEIDASKLATFQVWAPDRIHVNVSDTYQYYNRTGIIETGYFYRGDTLPANHMFGWPDATAGDITVIY